MGQAPRQENHSSGSYNHLGSKDEVLSQEEEKSEDPRAGRKPRGEGVIQMWGWGGAFLVAKWVKDLALSLQWLGSPPRSIPGPGTSICHRCSEREEGRKEGGREFLLWFNRLQT